jgi:hypothetical protein
MQFRLRPGLPSLSRAPFVAAPTRGVVARGPGRVRYAPSDISRSLASGLADRPAADRRPSRSEQASLVASAPPELVVWCLNTRAGAMR